MKQTDTAVHFKTAFDTRISPLERIGETPAIAKRRIKRHIDKHDWYSNRQPSMAQMVYKQGELISVLGINKSTTYCGKYAAKVNPRSNSVKVTIYKNRKYKLSGCAQTCKNKYCLHCGGRKQREFIDKLCGFMVKAKNKCMKAYLVTQTKNKSLDIGISMEAARNGFTEMTKKINDLQRTYGEIAIVGNIEASFGREKECQKGKVGKYCHIHFHGIVAISEDAVDHYDKIRRAIDKAWEKGVRKNGGYVFTEARLKKRVHDWIPISTEHGIRELGRYMTKEMAGKYEDTSLGHELSSMTKSMGGRGLHTLLSDICKYDDAGDVAMYLGFMKAVSTFKPMRSNRTFQRIAKEGKQLVEDVKNKGHEWTEDALKRYIKASTCRWNCDDIMDLYKQRTVCNEAISNSIRQGTYKDVAPALHEQMLHLSEDIDVYEGLLMTQNEDKVKMIASEYAEHKKHVAGEVNIAPAIWNAISLRHGATFVVIDFYTEHYCDGKHKELGALFTDWLQQNSEYHTDDPRLKNDETLEALDVWIWNIKKVMGWLENA